MSMQSESIGKLAEALSKAQGTMLEAKEDSKNPFFKSTYADLTSIWRACRRSLTENGLSVVQSTDFQEQLVVVITTLMHSSGEYMKGRMPLFMSKQDSQTLGSAITYAKRYALAAIVGVCVEGEDDDAEKAQDRKESITEAQLRTLLNEIGQSEEKRKYILKSLEIEELNQVPKDKFATIMNWLMKSKEKTDGKARVA